MELQVYVAWVHTIRVAVLIQVAGQYCILHRIIGCNLHTTTHPHTLCIGVIMNTIREIEKINEEELERGIAGTSASWHSQYSHAPWVYVGNLDHSLTEGDVLCVLSQYGELEDLHLVREEDTGKSKGFCFAKYEDARSAVLAVDNLIGIKVRMYSMYCL